MPPYRKKTLPYKAPQPPHAKKAVDVEPTPILDIRDVNIIDLEMNIGVVARQVIEAALTGMGLTAKEKCDVALKAITTLEGSKQEVTWRDELAKKPRKKTIEAYKKERELAESKLKQILLRRQEVKIAQGEAAVEELEKRARVEDDTSIN